MKSFVFVKSANVFNFFILLLILFIGFCYMHFLPPRICYFTSRLALYASDLASECRLLQHVLANCFAPMSLASPFTSTVYINYSFSVFSIVFFYSISFPLHYVSHINFHMHLDCKNVKHFELTCIAAIYFYFKLFRFVNLQIFTRCRIFNVHTYVCIYGIYFRYFSCSHLLLAC